MYKYIFFDLDGTLIDPVEGITNSVAYSLEKFNIIVSDRRELYKFIGPPLLESYRDFYGFNKEDTLKAIEYYREFFRTEGIFQNEVYPHIYELLEELKNQNKILAIATSKPDVFTERILEYFHMDKYFDFVSGASLDLSKTKKGDILKYAIDQLKIKDKSEIIMVGDRYHDIEGANQNNIDSIGVAYGYGSVEELKKAGADFIAEEVLDILKIVSR